MLFQALKTEGDVIWYFAGKKSASHGLKKCGIPDFKIFQGTFY
jgi:hypothetical protein